VPPIDLVIPPSPRLKAAVPAGAPASAAEPPAGEE
jgi:hypothetical protein